jgi:hypothetical protein
MTKLIYLIVIVCEELRESLVHLVFDLLALERRGAHRGTSKTGKMAEWWCFLLLLNFLVEFSLFS